MTQTLEQLSAAATDAVKTTGDKYFGDYELSKDQWEAVDALVEFARVVTHQLRTGQLVAVSDDAIERVARALLRAKIDRNAKGYEHLPEDFNVPFAQDYFDANVVIAALAAKGTGDE